MAAGIGKHFGVRGVLVRAYKHPPEPIGGWSAEDRRRFDEVLFRQQEAVNERAKELEEILGSQPEIMVVEGDAGEGDERKTLVAMGSRGLGMIGRARLGSVSTKVLRAAEGPVLVCPRTRR